MGVHIQPSAEPLYEHPWGPAMMCVWESASPSVSLQDKISAGSFLCTTDKNENSTTVPKEHLSYL